MNSLVTLLRSFTIRTRMVGAIGIVLVLLAAVGIGGLYAQQRLVDANTELANHVVVELSTLGELRSAMGHLRRFEKDMLLSYENTDAATKYHQQWSAAYANALKLVDSMLQGEEDEDNVILRQLRTDLEAYAKGAEGVFRQVLASGYDNAAAANKLLDARAKTQIRGAEERLEKLSVLINGEAAEVKAHSDAAATMARNVLLVALVLSLAVVVPLTLVNMVSICRPLTEAQRAAGAIAEGDLSQRIEVSGRDETADLLRALAAMQQRLHALVGQVRGAADTIQVASVEVASGNADLSSRTEQTASSLQQTASSMEQLTGTVRQSADSANTANQLASSAASVARRGGEVVTQVVTTMDQIQTSSKKIADIIGTIDGIAFQTNILALNAAVEAARAGEQGRGFAVVAEEVRKLAEESQGAAGEIAGLIAEMQRETRRVVESVAAAGERTQSGTATVARARDSFAAIDTAVEDVAGRAAAIAEAIRRLSADAEQMAGDISSVAEVAESSSASAEQVSASTQQTTASTQEIAASAQQLAASAGELERLVGAFTLR